jgi:hypothetical protein
MTWRLALEKFLASTVAVCIGLQYPQTVFDQVL